VFRRDPCRPASRSTVWSEVWEQVAKAKLAVTAVKAASTPGRYGDGEGFFRLVGRGGAKSRLVRVQKEGNRRDIGLGSAASRTIVCLARNSPMNTGRSA
jgi:hypothetical protein